MLMRWSGTAPVPKVDGRLTLDVLLPENSEFGPRVMRCRTEVTRVIRREEGEYEVALRVITMRFIKPGADAENTGLAQAGSAGSGVIQERRRTERRRDSGAAPARKQNRKTRDLASMPVATEHIS